MIVIKALEEQKAVFTTQKNELEEARSEIYKRKEQAMNDALLPYFEGFHPDVYIEVTRGSIYFKMDHPDYNYRKELFTLYLRERYFEEGQRYDGVDLSYYTTSTKGDDEWELKRLRILGDAAGVVLKLQHDIVDTANYTSNLFNDEFTRSYEQMNLINQAIRELDVKILAIKKEKIEFDLKNEGVIFDVGVNIQLKHNYTPYIKFIKLIDISKSGKTATASIIWARSEHEVQEENVRINDVVNQVLGFRNTIIKKELAN